MPRSASKAPIGNRAAISFVLLALLVIAAMILAVRLMLSGVFGEDLRQTALGLAHGMLPSANTGTAR